MNQLPQSHPGLLGATMSLGAGLISFLSHSLLIVQWVAGVFAIFAALASIASVLRHWDKGR